MYRTIDLELVWRFFKVNSVKVKLQLTVLFHRNPPHPTQRNIYAKSRTGYSTKSEDADSRKLNRTVQSRPPSVSKCQERETGHLTCRAVKLGVEIQSAEKHHNSSSGGECVRASSPSSEWNFPPFTNVWDPTVNHHFILQKMWSYTGSNIQIME